MVYETIFLKKFKVLSVKEQWQKAAVIFSFSGIKCFKFSKSPYHSVKTVNPVTGSQLQFVRSIKIKLDAIISDRDISGLICVCEVTAL